MKIKTTVLAISSMLAITVFSPAANATFENYYSSDNYFSSYFQGEKGDTGATGPAGADGQDGAQGSIGDAGPAGADGQDGAQGPTGDVGPAGANGQNGFVGRNVLSKGCGYTGVQIDQIASTLQNNGSAVGACNLSCNPGTTLISGGCSVSGSGLALTTNTPYHDIANPSVQNNGWSCDFINLNRFPSESLQVQTTAICVNTP